MDLSKRYEQGERLYFKDELGMKDFIKYYILQYNVNVGRFICKVYSDTSTVRVETSTMSVDSLSSIVLSVFGRLETELVPDQIQEACIKASEIVYDLAYKDATLDVALVDKKGVCWHYVKVVNILLKDRGLQTEVCYGTYRNDVFHMWLKVYDGERWWCIDPTFYSSTFDSGWLDISVETEVTLYKEEEFMFGG